MTPTRLDPDQLTVSTFEPDPALSTSSSDPFCCTGCVSGCGIRPTAGYCESGGGDTVLEPAAY